MALTRPRAAQIYNLDYKQAARAVTTTNVTLSGGAPSVVDGVSLNLGDSVLVTAQTTGSQNGIYTVTTVGSGSNGTWALRSDDNGTTGSLDAGTIIMITEGVVYADTQWKLITDNPIVIGTTALTFVQNYSANSISAGTSNVSVISNANVTISSAGTANVLTVSSTGIVVTGTAIYAGSIIPSAANTYTLGNTTNTWQEVYVGPSSLYIGGNALSAVNGILAFNGANIVTTSASSGNISVTGNITGGNVISQALVQGVTVSATGAITATANITGGNILTAGQVSATGNITGGNILTGGIISSTGTATLGNSLTVNYNPATTVNSAILAQGANTQGGTGYFDFLKATNQSSGATTPSKSFRLDSSGSFQIINNAYNSTLLTLTDAGVFSVASNISTGGQISANGNVTAPYFIGNGSALTGIVASAGSFITNGTSNVSVASGSNVTVTVSGSTVATFYSAGLTANSIAATSNGAGTNFKVGDDAWIGDINVADGMSIRGQESNGANGYVIFGNADNSRLGRAGSGPLTYDASFSAVGNITGGNILTGGIISATGNVSGGNVAAATAIFSLGTVGATGNTSGGNLTTGGQVSATGNITGGNISATNHTGTTVSVTGTVTAASTVGGVITGSSVSVTGNVTGGNLTTAGLISSLTTTANTITTTLTSGADANFNLTAQNGVAQNLTNTEVARFGINHGPSNTGWDSFTQYIRGSASQNGYQTLWASNTQIATINSSGILVTGVTSATGNITGGNISATNHTGTNVSVTGTITASSTVGGVITGTSTSVTGTQTAASTVGGVITGSSVSVTGTVTGASLAGTITTASQPNITSLGTLTGLTVSGAIVPNANATINLGSSSAWFANIYGTAVHALYADLAEMYSSDAVYPPGTIVEFGGNTEITQTTESHSVKVAGIVSTNPSYLMNSTLDCENPLEIALVGRVPCWVVGAISKGDRLVSSEIPGVATSLDLVQYQPGCIVGKALKSYNSDTPGIIEVAVGRL
jgi:hypothetical protein